jgi:hypothetical protein
MACHKRVSAASHAHKASRLEETQACLAGRPAADLRRAIVQGDAMNLSALTASHCEGN